MLFPLCVIGRDYPHQTKISKFQKMPPEAYENTRGLTITYFCGSLKSFAAMDCSLNKFEPFVIFYNSGLERKSGFWNTLDKINKNRGGSKDQSFGALQLDLQVKAFTIICAIF